MRMSMRFSRTRPRGARDRGAFTLIEVVLAMGVLAFGILTVMSLYTAGLDQLDRAERDVRAVLFAEEVFASLRLVAAEGNNWDTLTDNNPTYSFPVSGVYPVNPQWVGDARPGAPMRVKCDTPLGQWVNTLVFTNNSGSVATSLRQYALRYRIFITNITPRVKGVILRVGGGQYGSTGDMQLYYTELYKMKP